MRSPTTPYSPLPNKTIYDSKDAEAPSLELPSTWDPSSSHPSVPYKAKRYQCNMCDASFHFYNKLAPHHDRLHGPKIYKCPYSGCNMAWGLHRDFTRHLASAHVGDKITVCQFCPYSAVDPAMVKRHEITKHPSTDDTSLYVKCPECAFTAKTRALLADHVLIHAEKGTFSCAQCDYITKTAKCLKTHVKNIHSGEKKKLLFECSLCDFTSNTKKTCDAHMAACKGEQPYCCTKCDYKTSLMANLYSHAESHFKQ